LFLQIQVAPYVDFSKVEEVLVLVSGKPSTPEGKKTHQ
jgi:hypothetical protein